MIGKKRGKEQLSFKRTGEREKAIAAETFGRDDTIQTPAHARDAGGEKRKIRSRDGSGPQKRNLPSLIGKKKKTLRRQ